MRTLKLVLTLFVVAALCGCEPIHAQGGAGAFSWGWLVVLLPLVVWRARRRAALGDDQDAAVSPADAQSAARAPERRSGMRLPRVPRSARSLPMRVPRLSMRN